MKIVLCGCADGYVDCDCVWLSVCVFGVGGLLCWLWCFMFEVVEELIKW